jgi:hypothetical protein
MVTPCRLVAPLQEALGTGGTTIASATRARSPRVATSSGRYNNPLAHLATGAMQGLKAKLHQRQAFMTLPRLILGRRSMMAATTITRRDRPDRYHDDDDNDRFPVFTSNIIEKSNPKDFKPVRIPKYDGKQDPLQWI